MTRETFLAGVLADATRTFRYRSGVAWLLGYPDAVGPEPVAARPPASALPYVRSRRSSRQTAWAVPPLDDWEPPRRATTAPMPTPVAVLDDSVPGTPATRGHLPLTPAAPSAFGDARSDDVETERPEEFFIVAPDPVHHDAAVATFPPERWVSPEAPGVHRSTRVPDGDIAAFNATPRIGRAATEPRSVDHAVARPARTVGADLAGGPAAPALRGVGVGSLRLPHDSEVEVLGSEPDDVPVASLVDRPRRSQSDPRPEGGVMGQATTGQQDAPAVVQPSAADVSVGHTPLRTPSVKHREPGAPVPVVANPSAARSGRLRLAATAVVDDVAPEAFDDAPWPPARLATTSETAFASVAEDLASPEPFGEPQPSQTAMAPPVPDVVQILPVGDESYGGATAFWTRRHMRRWQLGLLR